MTTIACAVCGKEPELDFAGGLTCPACGRVAAPPGTVCPVCRKGNVPGSRVCGACGENLVSACRVCGRDSWAGADVCPGCGQAKGNLPHAFRSFDQFDKRRREQLRASAGDIRASEEEASRRRLDSLRTVDRNRIYNEMEEVAERSRRNRLLARWVAVPVVLFILLIAVFIVVATTGQ